MTRITDLSTQRLLVEQMTRTQQRLVDSQVQVTSEKKSQVYSGIVSQSSRLLSLEVSATLANRYVQNNETAELRLNSAASSIEAVESSVKEFQRRLQAYKSNLASPPAEDATEELQKWAISSLKDIQSYLNLEIDGQYLFSGTKTTTQPVNLNITSLSNFQSTYDGQKVTYPTTRDAHLQDFTLNNSGTGISATTDWLVFDRNDTTGTSTLTLGNGTGSTQSFTNLKAGSTITISNSASNNGTYTVQSVDSSSQITIKSSQLVTPTNAQPEQVTITKGDGTAIEWGVTGGITFGVGASGAADTLTAATPASVSNFAAGDVITVSGSGGGGENDKTFTVASVNTATGVITLDTKRFEDEGVASLVAQTGAAPEAINITNSDGTTYLSGATGGLTINDTARTITAATGGSLAGIAVGDVITLAGSNGGENDKSFTVASNDGTVITLQAYTSNWEVKSTSWYQGNDQDVEHRLNEDRAIDLDFNAIDPAIEKAIRAMSIIAQGVYGTAGGLDQNTDRLDDANYLLEDALSFPTSGTPPFGTEQTGSFEQIAFDLGFMQVRVSSANDAHERFVGFLEKNISDIEDVDLLEAITTMQDQSRTLEASYQVFSRFQELSLNNYL
ncbi:flagellin [Terasakiella sp. A23]|uniref:flagellin n=1 Tax=Terasakiella sp. FCG-A23 TaxID=3080561 RepID=UPI002952DCF9|nr:flagellin [Terasakiella sp. A23]MDV7339050.1 flagellin [Terasakiella sp. A23]